MRYYITERVDLLRSRLTYDRVTGAMTWGNGNAAGWIERDGYKRISFNGRNFLFHRVIWAMVTGEWPEFEIDHRNQVKSDNHWDNLRLSTRTLNLQNQMRAHRNNALGILGVGFRNGRYRARITVHGKTIALGDYSSKELAAAAYFQAKKQFHVGAFING